MTRLVTLAFVLLTIFVGAVVVAQETSGIDEHHQLAIGQDTPMRITVWVYLSSVFITAVAAWKASKWDSARSNKIEQLRLEHQSLQEEINALKAQSAHTQGCSTP